MTKRRRSEAGNITAAAPPAVLSSNYFIESSGVSVTIEQLARPSMDALRDVDLVIEGEVFKCHKMILVVQSRYFEAMLTNGMRESGQRVIELKQVDKSIWRIVMKFMYEGTLEIDTLADAFTMLEFTRRFMMDLLESAIVKLISRHHIDGGNCWEILDFVDRMENERSTAEVLFWIYHNFWKCLKTRSLQKVRAATMLTLLTQEGLTRRSEYEVFEALIVWMRGNPEEDATHLYEAIRWPLLNIFELQLCLNKAIYMEYDAMAAYIHQHIQARNPKYGGSLNERGICTMHQAAHPRFARTLTIFLTLKSALGENKKYTSPWKEDPHSLFQWRIAIVRREHENNLGAVVEMRTLGKKNQKTCSEIRKLVGGDYMSVQIYQLYKSRTRVHKCTTPRLVPLNEINRRSAKDPAALKTFSLMLASRGFKYEESADSTISIGATIYLGPVAPMESRKVRTGHVQYGR